MKKVCFPVVKDDGLSSVVYNHFGSAPHFLIVDTETKAIETLLNQDLNHQHGQCNPMKALGKNRVDAVVVGGIGTGAIRGLNMQGIKVFKAHAKTVEDNLELLSKGRLSEMTMSEVCDSHGPMHIGGHSHDCCAA